MTSRFSTTELLKSLSNYPVAKGDVVGHEFHGNQYTGQSSGLVTVENGNKRVPFLGDNQRNIDHFDKEAQRHISTAQDLRRNAAELRAQALQMEQAAKLHDDASVLAQKVVRNEKDMAEPGSLEAQSDAENNAIAQQGKNNYWNDSGQDNYGTRGPDGDINELDFQDSLDATDEADEASDQIR